jgi:hypothetical protein
MIDHVGHARESTLTVVACSLCLRVSHQSQWVEAEFVIRRLRTFELPAALRLEPGICDGCADDIAQRRLSAISERPAAA